MWCSSGGTLTWHHVATEQDPDGGDERAKHHHEADKQPETSSCPAKAALSIRVSSDLAIRNCIYHEESYGGEDATRVECVVHLLLGWIRHCCVNHDPPACEEQNSRDNRSHCVPPLPPVNAFALWPAEVIQKASHL